MNEQILTVTYCVVSGANVVDLFGKPIGNFVCNGPGQFTATTRCGEESSARSMGEAIHTLLDAADKRQQRNRKAVKRRLIAEMRATR